jgi:3-oxoacyl-[acyl-carrier protein] reductase
MDLETWKRGVETVKPGGYFNMIRHAVPHMMEKRWGRVINATSRAWLGDFLPHAEYCAANAAVVGLTRGIAKELLPYGITCNAFAPFAKTRADYELRALEADAEKNPWLDGKYGISSKESPEPDKLAPFIAYLASGHADKISGSVFNLAGNGVALYSEPATTASMVKFGDEAWTVEEISRQAPTALFRDYRSPAIL